MKAVFAHDHVFKKDIDGNYYTGACFNNTVWKRYLKNFQKLTVLARLDTQKISKENKYNIFELENLLFKPVPSLSGPLNMLKNRKKAKRLIYEELSQADILIARLPSEIGNEAIKIAKKLNKPYLIEVVGCIWDSLWNYGTIQAKIYAPLAYYRMKKLIKHAEYAIYVTNYFLQKRYPTNATIENISNVELNDVNEEVLNERMKRYSSTKDSVLTIGMIGSLDNKIKGLDVAFKALNVLKKENIEFQFRVLGDGSSGEWMELAKTLNIEENIEFSGFLPGGEPVLKWLDNIDIYIQPSYQEGLPRAVIEAMSRGCPVIGSNAGGIPELISNDMIHKKGDHSKLAALLKQLILTPSRACTYSKQNIEEAKKYTKKTLDEKRKNFFENIFHDIKNKNI